MGRAQCDVVYKTPTPYIAYCKPNRTPPPHCAHHRYSMPTTTVPMKSHPNCIPGGHLLHILYMPSTMDSISPQSTEQLYFVTDGGETNGVGYYGWVIATMCGILVEGKGHATGLPPLMESLCTESMSILSLLCFLLHYSRFHGLTITPDAWFQFCNNSTAVKRMNWFNV
eukprot:6256238-Ditylum_brightwellii.AAC.1